MEKIPEPEIMKLDPNDENLILGIPEDILPSVEKEEPTRRRVKKYFSFIPRFIINSSMFCLLPYKSTAWGPCL